jgi:hypothetical protein
MFAGDAWRKFREGRKAEISWADACQFWSLTEKMSVEELRARPARVLKDLEDIDVRMGSRMLNKNAVLSDGRSVPREDVGTLLDTHAFLERRFSNHLRCFDR